MHVAFRRLAYDLHDRPPARCRARETQRAVDVGLVHRARRVRLERQPEHHASRDRSRAASPRSRRAPRARIRGRGRAFPRSTVRGPTKPLAPRRAACTPTRAAHPAWRRLVHAPSARYSMMPPAMLPATPMRVDDLPLGVAERTPTASVPAIAPSTLVGWKPAVWIAFGSHDAQPAQRLDARPRCRTAHPRRRGWNRSHAASTAGMMTAPLCTGPPSNVSSKSSPCAAVPLTIAASSARSVTSWPIAVHGLARVHAREHRAHVVGARAATHRPTTSTSSASARARTAGGSGRCATSVASCASCLARRCSGHAHRRGRRSPHQLQAGLGQEHAQLPAWSPRPTCRTRRRCGSYPRTGCRRDTCATMPCARGGGRNPSQYAATSGGSARRGDDAAHLRHQRDVVAGLLQRRRVRDSRAGACPTPARARASCPRGCSRPPPAAR